MKPLWTMANVTIAVWVITEKKCAELSLFSIWSLHESIDRRALTSNESVLASCMQQLLSADLVMGVGSAGDLTVW
jgi:hypothetical protein